MDTYVQQLSPGGTHDLFYTDDTIKTAYKNFLNVIIPKLSSYSSLFSWEIANDPRCYGALDTTTSGSCTPQTITEWTSEVATFITTLDPNHMAASGDGGFYCTGCPKLFPVPAPQPQPSTRLRKRRRGTLAGTRRSPLTQADVLADMFEHEKRAALEGRAQAKPKSKKSIRGAWKAPGVASWSSFKRTTTVGPAYNGFHGVDTEDILGIPQVSYSSFQFFPDQNTYSADGQDTSTPPPGGAGGTNLAQTIQTGVTWITQHADSANTYGKPSQLTGFGLVGQDSSSDYTPFDSTNTGVTAEQQTSTTNQQAQAYTSITATSIANNINGITQYQWGQTGLTTQAGSVVEDTNTSSSTTTGQDTSGSSPNDGYSSPQTAIKDILSTAATAQASKSGQDSS
jgi:mannan endo-1,4-beta-mannosidase